MKITGSHGFTLIELAIVLTVIAIVGAVILPSFLSTTDRARLRSDVQSARVLQNAADLYNAEQRTPLPRSSVSEDIETLRDAGYLSKDAGSIQTHLAEWKYDSGIVKVDISKCDAAVIELAATLDPNEQALIYAE